VPRVEPGCAMQGRPVQQSAVVVHEPPVLTQTPPPQTYGGTPESGAKAGFGAHGKPQQSALVAQAWPDRDPPSPHDSPFNVQRGIPRMSCWQTYGFWFTLPAQQLFSALQVMLASLQMAPAGLHELPLSQRPTGWPGSLLQVPTPVCPWTPPKPQQSESVRHSSPVGRQPLGGWQMRTPFLYGAHARLQQLPPQLGTPASLKLTPPSPATPPQTSPATVQPVVPGALGWRQTPTVAPEALLQSPPQHSASVAQTSPVCVQNEPPVEQVPLEQSFEQHSALPVHALPAVWHPAPGFNGVQVPVGPQVPLQHCAETVHAWRSDVHCVAPHLPALQTNVQHS
jgi:hypothetical protein